MSRWPADEDELRRGDITFEDEAEEEDYYNFRPDDPDYDLSEEAGSADWEPRRRLGLLPQWLIVVISLLLILALVLPAIFAFN